MNWLLLSTSALAATFLWNLVSILRWYLIAQKIGFPIIISPVSTLNPFYIIFYRSFPSVLRLAKRLPWGFGTWAKCTQMGWSFDDKHALHDEYGPVFTVVTPSGNEVTVADATSAHDVLTRRKDFIKPAIMYDQLNVFGRNLNTVEGKDWERQRRLTAPSFNEKTSSAVWDESVRQAQDMANTWVQQGTQGTFETVADTATLALHVLTSVGFGIAYPFQGGVRKLPTGHLMTYRDALSICMQNIITFAIFPKRFLSFPFLPYLLKNLGTAVKEFETYMEELLSHERNIAEKHGESHVNLMGSMIRASEDPHEAELSKGSSGRLSLTNEEIYGNIFAFNIAGHETTANTVAAALVLLAANPAYQEWISEEIDEVTRVSSNYEATFPRLKRCLAIMYETLRLHGSIVFIPKLTGFHLQTIKVKGKLHVMPMNTAVNINVQALHTDAGTWGQDVLEWKPDRWLRSSANLEGEDFIQPESGSYVPWADGPRVCVGRKFSQVEFVAVISTLFRKFRVKPAGSDAERGRKALLQMTDEMAISFITLQMTQPKRIALVWEERRQKEISK